jgi:ubiquinone/menaquinone biosynthesis C-methylase UbiE
MNTRDWQTFFDDFAPRYRLVDKTSLGFANWARRKTITALKLPKNASLADLMAGPGSNLALLPKEYEGSIKLIDFSNRMCCEAKKAIQRCELDNRTQVINAEATEQIPFLKDTFLLCTFGLKTLHPTERQLLCKAIGQYLPKKGRFAAVEFDFTGWAAPLAKAWIFFQSLLSPLHKQSIELKKLLIIEPDTAQQTAALLRAEELWVHTWRHPILPFRWILAEKQ